MTGSALTVDDVLARLADLEDPKIRAVNERHGDDHGVNLTRLRAVAKEMHQAMVAFVLRCRRDPGKHNESKSGLTYRPGAQQNVDEVEKISCDPTIIAVPLTSNEIRAREYVQIWKFYHARRVF